MPGRPPIQTTFRLLRRFSRIAIISLTAAAATLMSGTAYSQQNEVTAIRAGRIITLAGPAINSGTLLIRNGKIYAIGQTANIKIPVGARIIDARSRVLMPGLVSAYSTIAGDTDSPESISPDIRAIDGFDLFATRERLLRGGLTTAYVATNSRRLVSGQGGVVKLAGTNYINNYPARTITDSADVRVTLGALSKSPPAIFRPAIPPTTDNPLLPAQRPLASVRPAELAMLRQLLADARQEIAHPGARVRTVGVGASDSALHLAERRVKLRPIESVIGGKRPLRIVANTVADIRLALQFGADEKIKIVLEGGAEGGKIASEIAAHNVPVVASTPVQPGATVTDDFERDIANGKKSVKNLSTLLQAGVHVALMPATDSAQGDLLMLAAAQTAYGVTPEAALRSVTISAAEILGVGGRVGSLAIGKDADILVLSGSPLAASTHVDVTLINGQVVYQRGETPTESSGWTAIRAGRIYTVSHGIIENGILLLRNGKFAGINTDGIVPDGAAIIDASHSTVIPGMVDCYSYLGLHADAVTTTLEPAAPASGPVSAKSRLATALRADDMAMAEALNSGVTALLLAPPAGGAISGTATLIKTIQAPDRVDTSNPRIVKEVAAICFNLRGGAPRMGQPWVFEELLQGAKAYNQRRIQYVRDEKQWEFDRDEAKRLHKDAPSEPAEVTKDDDQEPFAALFRGEIPAFVHADRSDEILTALKVFRDENDLPLTLVGASDAFRVSEDIRKRAVGVAIGPEILKQDHGKPVNMPATLSEAGIRVMLEGGSSSGTQFLRLNAANAVRCGMDPSEALKAITLMPATALHVQERLGSIDPGKDADVVILSGDPLELTSRVEKVLVNGKVVYDIHDAKR